MKLLNSKKSKIILILLIIWCIFFLTDYTRVKNDKLPLFCTSFNKLICAQDGGTVFYFGIGYKVIDFNTNITYDTHDERVWDYIPLHKKYICPFWTSYNSAYNKLKEKYLKEVNI